MKILAFILIALVALPCLGQRLTELQELTSPAGDDLLLIYDASETVGRHDKKITFANLTSGITGSAVWPVAGANITAVTNGLAVTLSAAAGGATNKTLFVYDISTNEIPISGVTNIGSAAYSNATAFIVPAQLGSAAYNDATVFVAIPTNNAADGDVIRRTGPNHKYVAPSTLGLGSVTSVGASGPAGFTWSSPVTGSGTLTATTPGLIVTQGFSQTLTLSNNTAIDPSHTLTANGGFNVGVGVMANDGSFANSHLNLSASGAGLFADSAVLLDVTGVTVNTLTGSRMVLTSSGKVLTSAAASGAVPIDADGSAATFAQVNALAPGTVLTNGHGGAVTVSNTWTFKDGANASATITNGVLSAVVTASTLTNAGATAGAIVVADANKKMVGLANGGNNTVLHGTGPPAYSAVDLAADVTGSLPIASVATPGYIVTNGNANVFVQSNHVRLDVQHYLSLSNSTASSLAALDASQQVTNAGVSTDFAFTGNKLNLSSTATNIANISTPGLIVTNGESQAITISNTVKFQGASGGVAWNLATLVTLTNIVYTNVTLDFPSTATLTFSDLLVNVANLKSNDVSTINAPGSAQTNGIFSSWISNTFLYARYHNYQASAVNPSSGIFNIQVFQYK